MTDFDHEVSIVLEAVKKLGVEVVFCEDEDIDSCPLPAPFSWQIGIDYYQKKLYLTKDFSHETVGNIIHEVGHIVACDDAPEDSNEVEFLGWEIAFALELGLLDEWRAGQSDYTVRHSYHGLVEIGCLDDDELSDLVEESIDWAKCLGLVENEHAVAIR